MTVGTAVPYRITVLLLWAQALAGALTCRSLFWDGASFLANMLESGGFHDFYPSRAHIAWLTEAPTLLLARAGVRDVHLLAMVFSATLFAVPAALYHLALARVRGNGTLLAAMIATVGTVYLPTSFFNIGEHNITYALVAATFAIALTRRDGARDGAMMLAFGLVAIASYEAMIYLGLVTAAVVLWSRRGQRDPAGRMLSLDGGACLRRRLGRVDQLGPAVLGPSALRAGARGDLRLLAEPAIRHSSGRAGDDRHRRPGLSRLAPQPRACSFRQR